MSDDTGPSSFRWKLADDNGGQGTLFSDEELVDRHVGRGEFRGMEFLHVNAKRIINTLKPGARVPFNHTINAYRGCSHACSYCLSGDTPVLMADGRTKPIAELAVGDAVYGTERVGVYRRYVPTTVLAHWQTRKPAYRITLEDGTELVASRDHRFLSNRGWKHVIGSECGHAPRAHLTTEDEVLGMPSRPARCSIGTPSGSRVVSVEAMGEVIPMYDITTGTGDFIANGVISHNCFARPTHDYLGLNIGSDFDSKIVVKVNAVERARAEVNSPRWSGESIAMGTNTDPYQRCEGKYHLTRGIIEVLSEARNPFSILTKSTLILRDLDLLVEASNRTEVRTSFSIGTLDEAVWKQTEPGTPHPRRRVEAVARLVDAGVQCGVLVAPILPGMSDDPEQLREVAEACVEAGATSIGAIPLHLRTGVRDHFMAWLAGARPELVEDYERRYRGRGYLPKDEQSRICELVSGFVDAARRRHRRPSAKA